MLIVFFLRNVSSVKLYAQRKTFRKMKLMFIAYVYTPQRPLHLQVIGSKETMRKKNQKIKLHLH